MALELPNFSAQLQAVLADQETSARILVIGDSVSGYLLSSTFVRLNQAYGYGGVVGGPLQVGLYTNPANGTTVVQGDYSRWITGLTYNVPAGGTIGFNRSSSALDLASPRPVMKELQVSYLSQPDAGSFKIQVAPMRNGSAGTFVDLVGYENISTAGTLDFQTLSIPISDGVEKAWRVVGLQGNVTVVNGGWIGDAGLVSNLSLSLGGTQLVDYAAAPEVVWRSFLDAAAPDLVIVSVKDDVVPGFRDAVGKIQRYIHESSPYADTLFVAPYNSRADDPGYTPALPYFQTAVAGAEAFQDVVADPTIPGSKIFWDSAPLIGTWANGNANGWFQDNVHLNATGAKVLGDAGLNDFDLLPVPEPSPTALVAIGLLVSLVCLRRAQLRI